MEGGQTKYYCSFKFSSMAKWGRGAASSGTNCIAGNYSSM